jgi:hypothetical protein
LIAQHKEQVSKEQVSGETLLGPLFNEVRGKKE